MEARPKIKIQLTGIDKTIEIAGWLLLLITCILAVYQFYTLPQIIPVHYNLSGTPDRYGNKSSLFILPAIAIILFIGMTWLNKYPHVFNYPVNITPDNAEMQYRFATRLLRYMKMILALIFLLILIGGGLAATGKVKGLGWWFLPLVLGLTIIPAVYALVRSFRLNK